MHGSRVLVLYNEPVLPADHADAESEHEIVWTADVVAKVLLQAGHQVTRLGASFDVAALISGLRAQTPDVVFNLFEGTADQGNNEASVAGLLEWLGLPFTGSPALALLQARHKHVAKYLLRGAGLPTPEFQVVERLPLAETPREWPVIVKPALQDASVGIDQGSVITEPRLLANRVAYVLEKYGPPVLVERFIRGREFTVSVVETNELRVLPIGEIRFLDDSSGRWPIVSYDAKWRPSTPDFRATQPDFPSNLGPELTARLNDLACRAFRLLGCRDYARIDFRVSADGTPYVLEVNPNPCVSPLAGLTNSLEQAGQTHAQFIVDLVERALARGQGAAIMISGNRPTRPSGPPPDLRIRQARADDRNALLVVIERCGALPAGLAASYRDRIERAFENGTRTLLLAEEQGALVGVACFGRAEDTTQTYRLEVLAVTAAAQRRGIGGRLLRAVEANVTEIGGRLLLADVSAHAAHAPARQLLLRDGYRQVGDVPGYYREGEGILTFARYL